LGIWIRRLLESEPFEVWSGEQLRDQTYVDDVVDSILLAAGSENANGKVMNVSSGSAITLEALAELIVRVHGSGAYTIRTFPAERKRIDVGSYSGNNDLLRSVLEWAPKTPLADGLRETIAYYQKNWSAYV